MLRAKRCRESGWFPPMLGLRNRRLGVQIPPGVLSFIGSASASDRLAPNAFGSSKDGSAHIPDCNQWVVEVIVGESWKGKETPIPLDVWVDAWKGF